MPDLFSQTWDAICLPKGYVKARSKGEQFQKTFNLLERLLAVDKAAGEHAWAIQQQPGDYLFVSKVANDILYFPAGHPRSGHPRYTWIDAPDGVRFGKLVPDAQA